MTLTNNGTLVLPNINLSGGSVINNGTLEGSNALTTVHNAFASTGAVVEGSGSLRFLGRGSFAGAVTGTGTVVLAGGSSFTLGPALALPIQSMQVSGSGTAVTLASDLTDTGSFTLLSGTALQIASFSLAAAGAATLKGEVSGSGTVDTLGITHVDGLALSGTATL